MCPLLLPTRTNQADSNSYMCHTQNVSVCRRSNILPKLKPSATTTNASVCVCLCRAPTKNVSGHFTPHRHDLLSKKHTSVDTPTHKCNRISPTHAHTHTQAPPTTHTTHRRGTTHRHVAIERTGFKEHAVHCSDCGRVPVLHTSHTRHMCPLLLSTRTNQADPNS